MEISIRRGDFYIFKILKRSKMAITFFFMILNTLLLHGLRKNKDCGFYWLIQPQSLTVQKEGLNDKSSFFDFLFPRSQKKSKICRHKNSCDSYLIEVQVFSFLFYDLLFTNNPFQGIKSYLKFGCGLEIARNIIAQSNVLLKEPFTAFANIANRLNWNLIGFLVFYVGIYRVILIINL